MRISYPLLSCSTVQLRLRTAAFLSSVVRRIPVLMIEPRLPLKISLRMWFGKQYQDCLSGYVRRLVLFEHPAQCSRPVLIDWHSALRLSAIKRSSTNTLSFPTPATKQHFATMSTARDPVETHIRPSSSGTKRSDKCCGSLHREAWS